MTSDQFKTDRGCVPVVPCEIVEHVRCFQFYKYDAILCILLLRLESSIECLVL